MHRHSCLKGTSAVVVGAGGLPLLTATAAVAQATDTLVVAIVTTIENIIYATAIINLPFYARMARAEVNVRRNAGFVQAARLSGNGDWRILAMHIFPDALPPMMVQISLNMGWAILNAAGLSFIGLGVAQGSICSSATISTSCVCCAIASSSRDPAASSSRVLRTTS